MASNNNDDDVDESGEERRSLCARPGRAGSKDACDTRNEGMRDERGKGGGEAKASRTGESWIDRCAQMRSSREWASEWAGEQGQAQAPGLERRVGGRVSG